MQHPAALPADPSRRSVRLGQRSVEYRLRRSARSRGLRVTIDDRDGLVVSVPLEDYVLPQTSDIVTALRRLAAY